MTQPIHLIAEIYAVEVPEGADVSEVYIGEDWYDDETVQYLTFGNLDEIPLSPGNWQIICTTKECLKKVPMGIVECKTVEYDGQVQGTRFVNYLNDNQRYWFINKTESLRSLLTSKGLDPVKNYILIKKLK